MLIIAYQKLISPWTQKRSLEFKGLTLAERTKHVHKLHPYKGKFIPQLAETLLNNNFNEHDLILDPFAGSGTTLVQSIELGINVIGIDISEFNCLLAQSKINDYNFKNLHKDAEKLLSALQSIKPPKNTKNHLKHWYTPLVARQLSLLSSEASKIKNKNNKQLLKIIISRTAKSCLATTHSDLSTLKKPVKSAYFCQKHNKICKPVSDVTPKFRAYLVDSLSRIEEYQPLKTKAKAQIFHADAKTVNYSKILKGKSLDGVLTSPPYVGQINYHKGHEYAFELLSLKRKDKHEIGPLFRGRRIGARKRYVNEMSQVLTNIKPNLKPKAKIILVANDRFNLYPQIAQNSGFIITKRQSREVTWRNEGDQASYAETIFTLRAL